MATYLKTSDGIIGIGLQTAKGSANTTPDIYIKYMEGSFNTVSEVTHLREGGDDELIGTSVKNSHKVDWSFKCLARPQVSAYLFSYFLGKDSISGSGDPYTHDITRSATNERAWLTIRRKVDTSVTEQIVDCRIKSIEQTGEAGKAIELTISGVGLTPTIVAAEDTASYESGQPFTFYDSCGNFEIENGVSTSAISAYSITYELAGDELQTDCLAFNDIPDLALNINFSATLKAVDEGIWKKANYNNGTSVSESLYTSQFTCDHTYTESTADDRELKVVLKDIVWEPVELNPNAEPAVQEITVAGILRKPSAGEIVTVTVKNDVSSYIYAS